MTQAETEFVWWIPFAAFAFWWGLLFAISRVSGWSALAEIYASDEDFDGPRRNFQTVTMKRGQMRSHYGNVVTFGADAAALRLSMFILMRPFHPRLKIPHADLAARRTKALGIIPYVEVSVARAPGVVLQIPVSAAEWIGARSSGAFTIAG